MGVLRDLCGALEPPNGSPEWELQLRQRPARRRPAPGTVQVPISRAIGLGPGAAPRPSTVWEAGSLTANVLGKWAGELFVRPWFGGAPRTSFAATHTHTQLLCYSTVLARSLARDALPRLHDEPCPSGASKRTSRRCEWTRCHIPSLWGPAFAPALRRDDDESQSKPARLPARSSNPPSWLAGCGCISCL